MEDSEMRSCEGCDELIDENCAPESMGDVWLCEGCVDEELEYRSSLGEEDDLYDSDGEDY